MPTDLIALAQLVNAVALTGGIIFIGVEIRRYRADLRREGMLRLLLSFRNATLSLAVRKILTLRDGESRDEIIAAMGPQQHELLAEVMDTYKSIAILLSRRELTVDLIADLFGNTILICWRKLHLLFQEPPGPGESDTCREWFLWLAERIAEHKGRSLLYDQESVSSKSQSLPVISADRKTQTRFDSLRPHIERD